MDNLRLTSKAQGEGYEKLRDALIQIESSNRPGAGQEHSSGRGLFQFLESWDAPSRKLTGRSLESFLPKDNSPAELERAGTEQREILFPKYFESEISPFVRQVRKQGLAEDQTDLEIAGVMHLAGAPAALKYFQTGVDDTLKTKGNKGIPSYVAALRRSLNKPLGAFKPETERQIALTSKGVEERQAAREWKKTHKGPMPKVEATAATKPVITSTYSRGAAPAAAVSMTPESMAELNRTTLDGLERLAMELRERSA